jgi:hypothetical protein
MNGLTVDENFFSCFKRKQIRSFLKMIIFERFNYMLILNINYAQNHYFKAKRKS